MNNFFKEEIKELLYLPTIKSKKIYSIVIETSVDILNINYKFTETTNKTNKLITLEVYINSQNKKELHIKQYNYYERYESKFIFSNKKHDFNLPIAKDNSNNLNIYQIQDIIFNVFLKDSYYNFYILKNNVIFNQYPSIYKNNADTSLRDLLQNYLFLIIFNKE